MKEAFCVKGQKVKDEVSSRIGIAIDVIPEDEVVIIYYETGENYQERYFMDVTPL